MPKGGLRIGAGRKPKASKVVGMDGLPRPIPPGPTLDAAKASPLAEPPEGLTEAQAALWRDLAPHAIAQQTLVPSTVRGFRELVEILAMKQAIADTIAAAGAATSGMDALLRHYAKLAQRVDGTLARYRLTAAGKPEPSAQTRPKPASPWAAVGGAKA